ncbi:MAG: preprotein translocase subunit SecE [Ruminococcaceae bacterium]|nr:preprotein translocase subunit SecE [Oscillospiraceae bacterium]
MAENKSTKAMKFFRETKAELKKVSWPSKSQLINNTVVILVFIVIATLVLSLLDVGFQKLLSFVIK